MSSVSIIAHSRPWIIEADLHVVQSALSSGMIAMGDKVEKLESRVCEYLGVLYGVAQSSGTAALILALKVLNISEDDEVILPTYVCRSVLEAVLSVGATPVLCDVDEAGVITFATVSPKVSHKTKVIIAVHIFGHPCDVTSLKEFGLPVIGDACQAFGLSIDESIAGVIGDIGILSFHATKCLTTGEGGMLVTNNKAWGERARQFANGNAVPAPRTVAPMSDLQAVLGLSQLARYMDFLDRRDEIRRKYTRAAQQFGVAVGFPKETNMLFRFTLRSDQPFEVLQKAFSEQGISVRRGVDELLHRALGLADLEFPMASQLFEQTVSVPFYPSLSEVESTAVSSAFGIFKHGH